MKICIECKDVLTERTLQLFLKEYLVMKKDCDFIITDTKLNSSIPQFIVNSDSSLLQSPFSKKELIATLEQFYSGFCYTADKIYEKKKKVLEKKIDELSKQMYQECVEEVGKIALKFRDKLLKALQDE
ncbi:ornithine carbamoyltransferase [Campylobacter sp. US33a]|uniref:Ornithine carbamoyltransferase n=1 Tax=Campylobacter sp. CCS1377 TaxID=3158229 RepID=A0AAU7E6F1_9BACT|nr:ornithine carbamoyltransferase [Campylobacter sp. US33a]MCW1361035.1 hypothetical protein [Campylobacter jejuni]TEY04007.1 ornithine carbamoyltransferase [Campylobacter sp. US33a]